MPLTDALTFLFPRVGVWYALVLLLVLAYWLWRVARAGARQQLARVAWWALPGWLALLYAPVLEQPTFFGIGAALLLLAEYWPAAYRTPKLAARPAVWWVIGSGLAAGVGLLVLAAALSATMTTADGAAADERLAAALGLSLLLVGVAGLCSLLAWPRPRRAVQGQAAAATGLRVGPELRFTPTVIPEWPDLSLSLGTAGAELHNISRQPLELAGWSPARLNAWLPLRNAAGQPLRLNAGESAYLPLGPQDSGVRVWYLPHEATEVHLFRANWNAQWQTTPPEQRILN